MLNLEPPTEIDRSPILLNMSIKLSEYIEEQWRQRTNKEETEIIIDPSAIHWTAEEDRTRYKLDMLYSRMFKKIELPPGFIFREVPGPTSSRYLEYHKLTPIEPKKKRWQFWE